MGFEGNHSYISLLVEAVAFMLFAAIAFFLHHSRLVPKISVNWRALALFAMLQSVGISLGLMSAIPDAGALAQTSGKVLQIVSLGVLFWFGCEGRLKGAAIVSSVITAAAAACELRWPAYAGTASAWSIGLPGAILSFARLHTASRENRSAGILAVSYSVLFSGIAWAFAGRILNPVLQGFDPALFLAVFAAGASAGMWMHYVSLESLVVPQDLMLRYRWSAAYWVAGLVVACLSGVLITGVFSAGAEERERRNLIDRVRLAVATMEPAGVEALKGTPEDKGSPVHAAVSENIHRIANSQSDVRYVYLLGWRGDRVVFLADAEPDRFHEGKAGEDDTGAVYDESSSTLRKALSAGGDLIEGPLADRWGTWITGFSPVRSGGDGKVLALMGMDIDAGGWLAGIRRVSFSPLFITLVLCSLIISFFYFRQMEIESTILLKLRGDEITLLADTVETQIWYLKTPDTYGAANRAHVAFLGRRKDEVEHNPVSDVVQAGGIKGWLEPGREVFEGRRVMHTEEWHDDDGGRRRLLSISRNPKLRPDGSVEYVVCYATDITDRRIAEMKLKEANETLTGQIGEINRRNEEMRLLNELGALLQICVTLEESYKIIARQTGELFPGMSGALYISSDDHKTMAVAASWGGWKEPARAIEPDDCWAIRRGRLHRATGGQGEIRCAHTSSQGNEPYLCVPMVAQGETLGLFHLLGGGVIAESAVQLAQTVADTIVLALANLKLRNTLRDQSIHDPLTRLYNRRFAEETLERELRKAAGSGSSLGILIADVDFFKAFNDTWGHAMGDQVLCAVSRILQGSVRSSDVACRIGGEEFLVILPGAKVSISRLRAEQVRRKVLELKLMAPDGRLTGVTVSIGVAVYTEHGRDMPSLLKSADTALYAAKESGRNRVTVAE